jgi:hypothetical protein
MILGVHAEDAARADDEMIDIGSLLTNRDCVQHVPTITKGP